jgi:peptide chain release factor 2
MKSIHYLWKRGVHFDPSSLKEKLDETEKQMQTDGFWNDNKTAQKILREQKILKNKYSGYAKLNEKIEDLSVLLELLKEDYSLEASLDIKKEIDSVKKETEAFRLSILLTGDYDANNAILSIHSGAGGTEAQDWVEMLLRMYLRWADKHHFKAKIIDELPGDVAGIKSVTVFVEGINAYGYLKAEKGVHRLVRISPFDSSGRRHTSFASLDVMPEIDDDIEVEIKDEDLRVDTYRSSGAGGQHVNKTDSAVRITHLPTGVVVQCQNERSQRQNRETALKMLKGKLIEIMESEHKEKIDDLKGDYAQIAWGSQIRSYVFQPYTMVKDHRTNAEIGNINAVMDGDIDLFINEYLKANA